uniref:Phosphatase tensin-type domain-containing protein n=1 Tax=Panagrellus redivivus TaxID=6233 RepID=A0A7E4VWX2_PANRE
MLCFKGSDPDSINCYGTPKFERRKKPTSAKKCATDPLLTDLIMAANSDRSFSSSNGARQAVPGGVEYTQISPRVIALTYPTNGSDAAYRHSIKEISEKLRHNYPDRYKIFNVSQKRSDLGRANSGAVVELGWPDQLAPPLDRLCSICKQIENWLNAKEDNLVVIHCKGWRSRAAIVVAAYMHYTQICAGEETAADRFSMQIFSEKFLGVDGQPSHKRYVRYFANLLSGKTKVNPAPIFLTSITLTKLAGKGIVVKIYERMKPVYSSQPVTAKSSVTIDVDQGLSLRGDVLVKCFEKRSTEERTLLFQCQFNTCALDLSSSAPNVYFYKEELDLITDDRLIDNQAGIEFRFVFEAPKPTKRSRSAGARRSLSLSRDSKERDGGAEFSRADSYENFDKPEDDRSISSSVDPPYSSATLPSAAAPTSPLYAELHKTPNGTTHTLPSSSAQASPLDGADSGIGSDSPKHTMVPPQVPPKPQTPVFDAMDPDDPMRSAYEDSTIGRDRSVLPAGLRPPSRTGKSLASIGAQAAASAAAASPLPNDSNRPISPAESTATHRSTSRIEPDLVAKDRYDPSSKCFSYVPAKALKEHYTAPKKPPPSLRRASMERSNLDIPSVVDHDSLRQISITPSELTRRAETPTWDSVVDKIAPKVELPEVRKHYSEIERERYGNGGNDYFSKTLPNGYGSGHGYGDEEYEKPVIVNQARQAAPTPTLSRRSEGPPRRRRFDSYGAANDDYNSDMDDFCDPEFYLSYASAPPPPPVDRYGAGSKSVELPRKPVKAISQRELDEIDSIIESTAALPPRACMTPKPAPPHERDAFRLRNCRSVTSAPRKLFSNERYDATTEADNPDDWLKNKLRTLHSKRSGRPDVIARKNTERILLEELKNANTERAPQRDEYVSEGYGQRPSSTTPAVSGGSDAFSSDPLEEYQREEARLHNTRSPFTAIDDFRAANRAAAGTPNSLASSTSRFTRGATPTLQAMRAKPPTPPPREVRSPPPSQSGRRSATTTPSAYQQERARLASNDYLSDDEDDAGSEFSTQLRSLVQDAPVTKHEPTTGYGTATKSILKRRSKNYDDDTYDSKSDIYASPRGFDTDSRAGGSSHYAAGGSASSTPLPSGNRAETPAFPVTTRETPLPFHPLLYQGAASGSNGSQNLNNAITTRSGSPRSMYYGQQSRRSSMTSIVYWFTAVTSAFHAPSVSNLPEVMANRRAPLKVAAAL